MKAEWLERSVVVLPSLCLCLSEEDCKRVEKELGNPEHFGRWVNEGYSATVHAVEVDGQVRSVVVCIDAEQAEEAIELLSLISHEALHIVQSMDKCSIEDDCELPALAQQLCFQRLVYEYCRQTGTELVFKKVKKK